jgi:hypothetical protein
LCLHDDLARARDSLGAGVPVIAVNAAAKEVKAIALFSQHPERLKTFRWIELQRERFGSGFTVHGCKKRDDCPHVEFWWEDARGGGSSAWGARKLAWLMGFDSVVLCGCPLDPMPYVNYGIPQLMADPQVHEDFHRAIEADVEWHEGVFSMSGWTRERFGEPC